MKKRDMLALGIPDIPAVMRRALEGLGRALTHEDKETARERLRAVAADPAAFVEDGDWGALAQELRQWTGRPSAAGLRAEPAPWRRWGEDVEAGAVAQMEQAARLPGAVRGALMPDAHQGYGLPIGGVLAVRGAVIPYAVGVDIACRVRLSVLDLPLSVLGDPARGEAPDDRLIRAVEEETAFGLGAGFEREKRRQHPVLDEDWNISPVTRKSKDRAWKQLGSSGGGNHFADFGELVLDAPELGLPAGRYVALLTHSGSRGTGEEVATHYSALAEACLPDLPREVRRLAWLDLAAEAGQEYWRAMELMGRYASANHQCIHEHIAAHLSAPLLAYVENHHNFAWKEQVDGEELIVHRKGATPAGSGVLGVIPGSMADVSYIVRGRGAEAALCSCSHGAGRRMSRTAALAAFTWDDLRLRLANHGVTLLSGSRDEAPMAYKSIGDVMRAQSDLVDIVGRFAPRLVKMAPEERTRGGGKKKR